MLVGSRNFGSGGSLGGRAAVIGLVGDPRKPFSEGRVSLGEQNRRKQPRKLYRRAEANRVVPPKESKIECSTKPGWAISHLRARKGTRNRLYDTNREIADREVIRRFRRFPQIVLRLDAGFEGWGTTDGTEGLEGREPRMDTDKHG